jgi:hypothetical protein
MLQKNYSNSDMDIKLIPNTLIKKNNLAETNNLYLIGSPEENLYLREILPDLPISFSKDSMELNGTYNRADYFIYSFKDGKFEVLKDEYFGSDLQIIK